MSDPDRRHGPDPTPRNRDPREAGWVLPAFNADEDAVTAGYRDGILAISVGLKTEQPLGIRAVRP